MRCSLLLVRFLIASCVLWLPQPGNAENRAFVAGINAYDEKMGWGRLQTAVNDANALEEVLRAAKFTVARAADATYAEFGKQWDAYLNSLQPGDLAVFYFGGHGFQVDGVNYLVLKDTPGPAAGETALLQASLNFHELMEQLQNRRPAKTVYILDSCRESPLPGKAAKAASGQLRGFAIGEVVYGTFVLYSAGPGQIALDELDSDRGKAVNSPYMRRLLPLLKAKDLGLNDIATRVRVMVEGDTRAQTPPHEQTPAYIDGIRGGRYYWDRLAPTDKAPALDATVTSSTVLRLGGFASWDENCQPRPAPRIATVSRPRHGRILTRFESFTAGGAHLGSASCVGTPQRGVAVYYAIDDAHTQSAAVDTVRFAVKHWSVSPSGEVTETYSIDLATKHSRRITGR
jgi:hypothetical protein